MQYQFNLTCVCLVFGAIVLTGCQGNGESREQAVTTDADWSTKQRSVLAREPEMRPLRMPESFDSSKAPELRSAAMEILQQAADSTNPLLRANAIEAMHVVPERITPLVRLGLGDENRGVRFVSAMTVGELRLAELCDLVEPLLDDESDSVHAAAIYAMRRCGRDVDPSPLAGMLFSPDPEVKGNAALVLGELGEASAIPMLKQAVHHQPERLSMARARIIELQIAEALVKLGDESGLEVIRASLFTPPEQGELAVLACQMCGRLNDQTYLASLREKAIRTGQQQEPAEIRLAATQAVAQLDPVRAPFDVALAYTNSEYFTIRAQAAAVLGWSRDATIVARLTTLLDDPNPLVQVAAAGAILRATAP
jgi:HEAT repeat protein